MSTVMQTFSCLKGGYICAVCMCVLFTSVKTLSSNLLLIGDIRYLVDIFAIGIQKKGSKLLIFHLFLCKQI